MTPHERGLNAAKVNSLRTHRRLPAGFYSAAGAGPPEAAALIAGGGGVFDLAGNGPSREMSRVAGDVARLLTSAAPRAPFAAWKLGDDCGHFADRSTDALERVGTTSPTAKTPEAQH